MSEDQRNKHARFEKLRAQIRQSTRRVGQATLATGALVLVAPHGITSATTADQIEAVAHQQADAKDRVSSPMQNLDVPVERNTDFSDSWAKEFGDNFGKV